jgi:hypothetical protein
MSTEAAAPLLSELRSPEVIAAGTPEEIRRDIHSLIYGSTKSRVEAGYPAKQEEAYLVAAQAIWLNLKAASQVFKDGGILYILLNDSDGVPMVFGEVGAQDLNHLLYDRYGIAPADKSNTHVSKFIYMRGLVEATAAAPKISFYHDDATNIAYIAERRGKLLRVTDEVIDVVPNGTDGQLFLFPEDYEPWEFDQDKMPTVTKALGQMATADPFGDDEVATKFCKLLFDDTHFEETILTKDEKFILLMAHCVLVFMGKKAPLLQMLGPTGAGKTSYLRRLGIIIKGKLFDVIGLSEDVKETETQMVNNSFLVFDNVSTGQKRDVRDLICRCLSNGRVERRQLYKNFERVTRPLIATLALTAIQPPFEAEAEIANRSLLFKLRRRSDFSSDDHLRAEVYQQRAWLMAELVARVRLVLKALKTQKDYRPNVRVRMADFATFILRIAMNEGWHDEAWSMLDAWKNEQDGSALENDAVSETMAAWMRADDWVAGTEFFAGQLLGVLSGAREKNRMGAWLYSKPEATRSFTRQLIRSEEAYANAFGMKKRMDTHAHAMLYRFEPTPAQLADIRSKVGESPKLEYEGEGE